MELNTPWRQVALLVHKIYLNFTVQERPGYLSRYSDSLRAGRSGDRIPVGARFSASVQTGPGAHPASCTMGTGSLTGIKRPGRGADHPPPSKRRGHERVGLYFYSPSGPSWPVTGRAFTFTINLLVAHFLVALVSGLEAVFCFVE